MAGESHVKVFKCPSCNGDIQLRAQGQSVTAVCSSCQSIVDVSNPNFQIISRFKKAATIEPVIPLGQRGHFNGEVWEVIGFMMRCDETGEYSWFEYLLFNPYHGFRWLFHYQGHWNFIEPMKEALKPVGKEVYYHDKAFKLYNKGQAIVKYVLGEFNFRIKVGDQSTVCDYINPPFMLSSEETPKEIFWTRGRYVRREEIRTAFNKELALPYATGTFADEPNPVKPLVKSLWSFFMLFFIILCLIQMVTCARASHNADAFSRNFNIDSASTNKTIVTEPFNLEGGKGPLGIRVATPIDNNWMEMEATLTNEDNQEFYGLFFPVSYYHGYDGGESWSEGHPWAEIILPSIPDGRYSLTLEPTLAPNIQSLGFNLVVKRDVGNWSNFWVGFCMILFWPLVVQMRSSSIESGRWAQSSEVGQTASSNNDDD